VSNAQGIDAILAWTKQLPNTWKQKRLKEVATIAFSNVDKKSEEGELPARLCNYTDVYYNEFITEELDFMQATASPSEMKKFRLTGDEVIITKDSETPDDIAVPAYVPTSLDGVVCGYHLAVIRPQKNLVSGRFLFRALKASGVREQFYSAANGITRYGLGQDSISNSLIPIPPINLQRSIASFLDRKTAAIDKLIEKKQRLIELLEEKRQAVISRAVTKGLNPNLRMKDSGVPWLGEIPEHWEVCQLRRVLVSLCDGPFGSDMKSSHYSDSGIRLIRLQNIGRCIFNDDDKAYVPEEHFNDLPGHDARPGDLLIAGLGDPNHPPGRACLLPDTIPIAMVKADCFRARLDRNKTDHKFIAYYLNSNFGRCGFGLFERGTTRTRVNLSGVREQFIPVPPVSEQNSICSHIESVFEKVSHTISVVNKDISILAEYRQALITAAVTGKIDVREERHERSREIQPPVDPIAGIRLHPRRRLFRHRVRN
jgi:type I restriction enzyme S subunit